MTRLLGAGMVVVRVRALGLRISLGHISACLGLPVKIRPRAVIHVACCIDPHHTWPATWSLWHRRGSRSRRHLAACRLGSRRCSHRCRHRSRSLRCSSRCCHRCSRGRLGRSRSLCRKPCLHPLMPPARAFLARSVRISPILALTRRSGRSSLGHGHLCHEKPRRHRHTSNSYLHTLSSKFRYDFSSLTMPAAKSYAHP
mgnify:CR=1 FL=1